MIARQEKAPRKRPASEHASPIETEKSPKKILIPEFTSEFRSSCESMPPPIVAKALRASAAFAAHDESVWRKTVTIKRLPKIYRIRLSVDHRLMIRWQPDDLLQILENKQHYLFFG